MDQATIKEVEIGDTIEMELVCDNEVELHITLNLVFYDRTKHIDIDCHFFREKLLLRDIITRFVRSSDFQEYSPSP